ncbi:hypothetical protein [Bradyrhizobium roseum]|uniref:hypothetical protein n=1 Tax=Bradyrhizobium roseum TaxID=3056648 RepID=UPI00260CFC26|nr:hypothetical protein [Bradyrhizobium roseus]WKA29508.1 hypothetical protein QUH67_04745 [Bradyrhizobium roseus]
MSLYLPFSFGCGAIAFYVLNSLPAFSTGSQDSLLYRSWSTALEIFVVSAPLLWIIALLAREPLSLVFLKVHAALYNAFLVVTIASNSSGNSSPGEAFAGFIIGFLFIILVGDAAIAIMNCPHCDDKIQNEPQRPEFVYVGVTLALLCGGYAGVLAWSSMLPPRIISGAETVAQDRPYCIDVDGRPARAARDLTGLSMRAPNVDGWTFNFHALLVSVAGSDRDYLNWSCRRGRFELVSPSARVNLHLDENTR